MIHAVPRALSSHWGGRAGLLPSALIALGGCQVLVAAISAICWALADGLDDPRDVLAVHLSGLLLSLPIEVWGWVGLFRAGRAASGLLRYAAMYVSVGGLVFLSVGGVAVGVVGLIAARYVLEGQGLREGAVSMSEDTLELRGDITWGLVDRALELSEGRQALAIKVHSMGGSLGAARLLANRLGSREVTEVWIDIECTSACSALLELSPRRVMTQNGLIRTHSPYAPGLAPIMDKARTELLESYRRAGVAEWWAQASVYTPANRFYRASTCELIEAGVITHIRTFEGETIPGEQWLPVIRDSAPCQRSHSAHDRPVAHAPQDAHAP